MGMVVRTFLPYRKVVKKVKPGTPENPQSLGDFIRTVRIENDLLQKDIATLFNVSEDTITYWENNRAQPDIHLYPAIFAFLGFCPFNFQPQTLGGKIKQIRFQHGYSYRHFGVILGAHGTTVRDWEANEHIPNKKKRAVIFALWSSLPNLQTHNKLETNE